jgi:hypothetical protein
MIQCQTCKCKLTFTFIVLALKSIEFGCLQGPTPSKLLSISHKNQQPNNIIFLCIKMINDISNVQTNTGVIVECYYLL